MADRFVGVQITEQDVSYRGTIIPLASANASVESVGEINRRVTVTRMALTGPFAFALKKKKDGRQLYLTVRGDGGEIFVEVSPKLQTAARTFAARVNQRAASARSHPATTQAPMLLATPNAGFALAEQLSKLSELHSAGALTDEEFDAAKARLLQS